MEQVSLKVQLRSETGKGPARRLRMKGLIPAVLYRGSEKPINLTVEARLLQMSIRGGAHTLLRFDIEGGQSPNGEVAIIKELQREPVWDKYAHVDFIRVDLTKPMDLGVAVEVKGVAPGVVLGGILQVVMREIEVRCLPTIIPSHIPVDVSKMVIGDSIHIKDLTFPEGVECIEDANAVVALVAAPQLEEKAKAVEEGAEGEAAVEGAAKAEGADKEKGAPKKDEKKKEEGKK